jgi:hypothetical protein
VAGLVGLVVFSLLKMASISVAPAMRSSMLRGGANAEYLISSSFRRSRHNLVSSSSVISG